MSLEIYIAGFAATLFIIFLIAGFQQARRAFLDSEDYFSFALTMTLFAILWPVGVAFALLAGVFAIPFGIGYGVYKLMSRPARESIHQPDA